jgi:CRISPR/Cas system-associated exonuclease Cas4 (RecB family)
LEAPDRRQRIIRASDIGEYVYCAQAWWLGSVEGLPSAHVETLEAGEAAHRHHGHGVRVSLMLRRLAYALMALAAALLIVTLVLR